MLQDNGYLGSCPEDQESFVSGREQKAEARLSQARVLEHSEEQPVWKGIPPHPIYPRSAASTRGRAGPDAPQ